MRKASHVLLLVPPLGGAACLLALFIDPHALLACYLAATVAVSAIPIGALAVLMITYLVRGAWTKGLHVPLMAAALTLPITGLLFLPVIIGLPWLYPWANGEVSGILQPVYLTTWFFIARTVGYFAVWTALAFWLRAAWGDLDRMRRAGSVGLIVYPLTASFAGIDWLESLTPKFHSSIYGLLFLTFQLLAGLAFAIAIALRPGHVRPTFSYGPILLSTLLLWAYMQAMQYIVIWGGDIPDEVVWYVRRSSGGWAFVLWGLMLLQFVFPFFAMLSQHVRNGQRPLFVIAVGTLLLRLVEAFWLVLPNFEPSGAVFALAIPGSILAVGGIWWLAFRMVVRRSEPPRPPQHVTLALWARGAGASFNRQAEMRVVSRSSSRSLRRARWP
jgi:hypothetical protein